MEVGGGGDKFLLRKSEPTLPKDPLGFDGGERGRGTTTEGPLCTAELPLWVLVICRAL